MHVTIIIVGFRNADDILRCLTSLERQTHRDFDIIICENGGDDSASALRAALASGGFDNASIAVIEARGNPGYAGAINRCLKARPNSGAWWILNPDTAADERALEEMVRYLTNGYVDAVGSLLAGAGGASRPGGGRFYLAMARTKSLGRPGGASNTFGKLNFVSGASMLVSRRWLDLTGPLRDDYFLYCEEVEWCLRARQHGLRVGIAEKAYVTHHQGSTTGSAGTIASRGRLPIYLDERNKLNTVRDTQPLLLATAIPASFFLAFLRYARRGAWKQLGFALSGWAAGVANRRGKPPWFPD